VGIELNTMATIGALTYVLCAEARNGMPRGGQIQRFSSFVCSAEYLDMEMVWHVRNMSDVCFGSRTDCRRIDRGVAEVWGVAVRQPKWSMADRLRDAVSGGG
jgi:hypothetical protein